MLALCVLATPALADARLFLPVAPGPAHQPSAQFGERASAPVGMAAYEMPRVVPVQVVAPEAQEGSVPLAWALTGSMLLGMTLYGGLRVSTLGVGGAPATASADVELAEYDLNTEWVEVPAGDKAGQMRPPMDMEWEKQSKRLEAAFGVDVSGATVSKEDMLKAYEMMQLCRQFENACNQAYMQGNIRGFMHLDNGQESIPAMLADFINKDDIKYSYYREHTHALASGIDPGAIMAELFAKDTGTCRGTGGSMHIYDVDTHFQGGWALVSEQLPYAAGAARSILLDRHLDPEGTKDDDRISVVFIGEGGAQNGRMAECLNAAAKENLPMLFLVIDNGRAINTFTPDVAANMNIYEQGQHYGVPGIKVDGGNLEDTMKTGRAVIDYVRHKGPAILQVHTYRFQGHSPADPEHERGRKAEKTC